MNNGFEMVHPELIERCRRLMQEFGLAGPQAVIAATCLTGGVSSDVLRVDVDGQAYCAKFALEVLRVAARWEAPIHRNRTEYAWLKFAASVAPDSVPRLYGHSEREQGFAMEMVAGGARNWKDELVAGRVDSGIAREAGRLLGRLHDASAGRVLDPARFGTAEDFFALRVEPYFIHLIATYPQLEARVLALAEQYRVCRIALIHGDVSPKNILVRDGVPVLLDAECATMGDPAFDIGFCLNHLLLKWVHIPDSNAALLRAARALWDGYCEHLGWEPVAALERRVADLVPLLLLARVDGKSPVEYLNAEAKQTVRSIALDLIDRPAATIEHIATRLEARRA
ncbi:phosphotransferase family protein (plasmid) [Sphingomonas panni]|uniref:phosphotransferase family protein n=1 Tax=Sphingomonas hankookensis TaxID=563996 RepID=UPI003D302206